MKIIKKKSRKFEETLEGVKKTINKIENKEFQNMLFSVIRNNEKNLSEENINKFEMIINAMSIVDRKYFAPFNCYVDEPIIIGRGQTISQPTTVARMLLMLDLKKGNSILEAGTGSGWNAALISYIVKPGKVITCDRIYELAKLAEKNINGFIKKEKQKINVKVAFADLLDETTSIWKSKYSKIIITAGVSYPSLSQVKTMALRLLSNNGLLIFPSIEIGNYGALELLQKKGNELKLIQRDEGYAFVPLLRKVE